MRTTLDLPDSLYRGLKIRAAQQGIKLKDLVTGYIEAGLKGDSAYSTTNESKPNPHPIPVAWAGDGTETPSRTNAEWFSILEEEKLAESNRISNPEKRPTA